jgi:hypothetical protein
MRTDLACLGLVVFAYLYNAMEGILRNRYLFAFRRYW